MTASVPNLYNCDYLRLTSGVVLMTGGQGYLGTTASTQVFSHLTNAWTAKTSPPNPRHSHGSQQLPSGNVIIAGGSVKGAGNGILTSIYNPSTDT